MTTRLGAQDDIFAEIQRILMSGSQLHDLAVRPVAMPSRWHILTVLMVGKHYFFARYLGQLLNLSNQDHSAGHLGLSAIEPALGQAIKIAG